MLNNKVMNTYNKLLLDEAQAMISLLIKYMDDANISLDGRTTITKYLEDAIDNLDAATLRFKQYFK